MGFRTSGAAWLEFLFAVSSSGSSVFRSTFRGQSGIHSGMYRLFRSALTAPKASAKRHHRSGRDRHCRRASGRLYGGKNLKFGGRVGTGFSVSFCAVSILNCKRSGLINVPFITSRQLVEVSKLLGPRIDCCRNEALSLAQTGDGLPDKIYGMDAGSPSPSAGLSWIEGRYEREQSGERKNELKASTRCGITIERQAAALASREALLLA
jgi:hypothetical protein